MHELKLSDIEEIVFSSDGLIHGLYYYSKHVADWLFLSWDLLKKHATPSIIDAYQEAVDSKLAEIKEQNLLVQREERLDHIASLREIFDGSFSGGKKDSE